jgi:hypothetical protein
MYIVSIQIFFVEKIICSTVKLGDKERFGHPKIVPYSPNVPYPYEVN